MAKAPTPPAFHALEGVAARAMRNANPEAFGKVQGDNDATARLAAIERRADRIKDRMRRHYASLQDRWVAREAIALWQRHDKLAAASNLPAEARRIQAPQSIILTAERNVAARVAARLTKINEIKTRLQNGLVRSQPVPAQGQVPQHSRAIRRTP